MDIAWKLLNDGRLLEIYRTDSATRKMTLLLALRRTEPMTEEDAVKYINDNYPRNGNAVRVAAEALDSN